MFVLHIPTMQLQNELPAGDEPLIFISPMSAGTAKKLPVPSAAGRDIMNADEGREVHDVLSDVA
jgi:hypothetical protein